MDEQQVNTALKHAGIQNELLVLIVSGIKSDWDENVDPEISWNGCESVFDTSVCIASELMEWHCIVPIVERDKDGKWRAVTPNGWSKPYLMFQGARRESMFEKRSNP